MPKPNRVYAKLNAMLTKIPNPEECPTITVPEAGRLAFGLGYTASYEAAKRGEIPTISIGRKLRVPVAALRRTLGLEV